MTVPYIGALLRNLEKRFGDMAKQIAVAARIFDPQRFDPQRPPASTEDTLNALESLCSTFRLDQQCSVGEWNIFASFLAQRSQSSLTELLQALITADLRDAFPVLSQLSSILLVCPLGTCLLYTSPSPRDRQKSRMPSSA